MEELLYISKNKRLRIYSKNSEYSATIGDHSMIGVEYRIQKGYLEKVGKDINKILQADVDDIKFKLLLENNGLSFEDWKIALIQARINELEKRLETIPTKIL